MALPKHAKKVAKTYNNKNGARGVEHKQFLIATLFRECLNKAFDVPMPSRDGIAKACEKVAPKKRQGALTTNIS